MADEVSDVGSGQTYADIAAWWAARTNSGNKWVANLTDAGIITIAEIVGDNIGGAEIRADASIAYNFSSPADPHVTVQSLSPAIYLRPLNFILRGIEFDSTDVLGTCVKTDEFVNQNISVIDCRVKGGKNGVKNRNNTSDVINLDNTHISGQSQAGAWLNASASTVTHCTIHDANTSLAGGLGGLYARTGVTVSNTVCYNNGLKDFALTEATMNNCASGDATAYGTSPVTGITLADFENTAADIYTAKVGGLLDGAGAGGTDIGIEQGVLNSITITSPMSISFIGRDMPANSATFLVTGTYTGAVVPATIEYSFGGDPFTTLDATPTGGAFSESITVPSGAGDLVVRYSNDVGITTTAENISIGIKILTLPSQSNFVGVANNPQIYTGPGGYFKKYTYSNNTWEVGADPFLTATNQGSLFPLLANLLVALHGVPVGFVNVSSGSTTLAQWQAGQPLNDRLLNYITASGASPYELAIGWIGESDATGGTIESTFKTQYNAVIDQFNTLVGVDAVLCGIAQVGVPSDNVRQWISDIVDTNIHAVGYVDMSLVYSGVHYETDIETQGVAQALFDGINTAFFTSTLNMTVTGAGNDTLSFEFYNRNTNAYIKTENVVFTSDVGSVSFVLDAGVVVGGFYDGLTPPTTGTGFYGITV